MLALVIYHIYIARKLGENLIGNVVIIVGSAINIKMSSYRLNTKLEKASLKKYDNYDEKRAIVGKYTFEKFRELFYTLELGY